MARLIITVSGRPNLNGHKIREFQWSPPHAAFIFEGREIAAAEFNEVYARALRNNDDLRPRVRVTNSTPTNGAITHHTVPAAHEITAEEAEAVMLRLAPERLKRKTGPKPAAMMEVS